MIRASSPTLPKDPKTQRPQNRPFLPIGPPLDTKNRNAVPRLESK